jgi:hypothetical protein
MKSKKLMCIAAMALLATLAIPVQLAGQRKARQRSHHKYHHYQLIDVGTFGGPQSFLSSGFDINPGIDVNQRGALVGSADTPLPDPFSPKLFHGLLSQSRIPIAERRKGRLGRAR